MDRKKGTEKFYRKMKRLKSHFETEKGLKKKQQFKELILLVSYTIKSIKYRNSMREGKVTKDGGEYTT